jgi:DNA-binding IclR family transcriptional regulator
MKDQDESGEHIPTVLRLLLLLEELTRIGRPATPTEINEALGLPKTTIHRLCETLEEQGFLIRDLDGRRYTPGARLQVLATGVLSSQRVRAARLSILRTLSDDISETCNITIAHADTMLYIDRIECDWPLRIQLPVGTRVPLYCTASGKLYLSTLTKNYRERYLTNVPLKLRAPNTVTDREQITRQLSTIRKQGYAIDNEEFIESMVAIAVPLSDARGRFYATLAVHAPVLRLTAERALEFLPELRAAAKELMRLAASSE